MSQPPAPQNLRDPLTAVDAGRHHAKLYQKEFPKFQILTVEGLFNGKEHPDAPPQANPFTKAEKEAVGGKQGEML